MTVSYRSVEELADALRRAAVKHSRHAQTHGHEDRDWPHWYAQHMVDEQAARPPGSQKFRHLPEHPDLSHTIAIHPVDPPSDPYGGRDTERDFLLRYGAGGDDLGPDGA